MTIISWSRSEGLHLLGIVWRVRRDHTCRGVRIPACVEEVRGGLGRFRLALQSLSSSRVGAVPLPLPVVGVLGSLESVPDGIQ